MRAGQDKAYGKADDQGQEGKGGSGDVEEVLGARSATTCKSGEAEKHCECSESEQRADTGLRRGRVPGLAWLGGLIVRGWSCGSGACGAVARGFEVCETSITSVAVPKVYQTGK